MSESQPKMRLAIMTFVYEGDRYIAMDLIDSVLRSFANAEIDVFLTDDASPSHVGEEIVSWCRNFGIHAICFRDELGIGYRGAVERTIKLLKIIASQPKSYDLILRIDTDALVIRPGFGAFLQNTCTDRNGLYGVLHHMRWKDRIGLLIDLLPFGLKREADGRKIGHDYLPTRFSPVWWWRFGLQSLMKGFRFGVVHGSCYVLGGDVPKILLERGLLDLYVEDQFGLITSEEDAIVTMMCTALSLPIHQLDRMDPTWRHLNYLGEAALSMPLDQLPYVIHPLKPIKEHEELREKLKAHVPFLKEKQKAA